MFDVLVWVNFFFLGVLVLEGRDRERERPGGGREREKKIVCSIHCSY